MKKIYSVTMLVVLLAGVVLGMAQIINEKSPGPYLIYGIPNGAKVIKHEYYVLGYNKKTKQADWVIHILNKDYLIGIRVKRSNNFREDPKVRKGPTPLDYKNSGYGRGHMAPAGDMVFSEIAMSECFYMTNMSPQLGKLNQKRWNDLENWIREEVMEYGFFVIITGPIFKKEIASKQIGNGVLVPQSYYKIIFHPGKPRFMVAFILPNEYCKEPLSTYVVSVDEVEKQTKLNFFSLLEKEDQDMLEAEVNSQMVQ